jgi:hypothetical protein
MTATTEQISQLQHEAGETHHRVTGRAESLPGNAEMLASAATGVDTVPPGECIVGLAGD